LKLLRALSLSLLLCSIFSCKQGQEKPPVPEEKMQEILVDMHLAESYSQGLGDSSVNRFQKNYDSLASFYTSILKHHSLSFEDFNEALEWYKERPMRIDTLYGKVLNQLNELKARSGIKDLEDPTAPAAAVPPDTAARGSRSQDKPQEIKNEQADTAAPKKNKVAKPVTKSEP
jgi:hypothetical protein